MAQTGRLAELWTTSGSRELLAYGVIHAGGLETLSYRGATFEYERRGHTLLSRPRKIYGRRAMSVCPHQ
jgi:hypothetical protein